MCHFSSRCISICRLWALWYFRQPESLHFGPIHNTFRKHHNFEEHSDLFNSHFEDGSFCESADSPDFRVKHFFELCLLILWFVL